MEKGEAVGRHDGDPKDALREGEVEAHAVDFDALEEEMHSATDAALGDLKLFDFDIEVGIAVNVDEGADEGAVAIAAMRLRGALLNAIQMMQGGVMDLLTAGDFTPEMRLAVSTWGSGGQILADGSVDALDEWLHARGYPTVSLYEVESSNIAAMGWQDPKDPALDSEAVILFTNGTLYCYQGVPEDVFAEWWHAESQGVYLNTSIKGNYPYKKLVG